MKLTIGAFRDGLLRDGSPIEFPFNGLIDEIEVFNRPLTGQEIKAIFAAGSAGKCNLIPLVAFVPQAVLEYGRGNRDDSFNLTGTFSLGADSDGIFPITEDVRLQVGAFTTIIPAGSFTQHGHGRFVFRGTINQVALWVAIQPVGGGEFRFTAGAEGVDLAGTLVPLTVKLTIGMNVPGQGRREMIGAAKRPFAVDVAEAFRIKDRKIRKVEALMVSLPYGATSPFIPATSR